MKISVMNFIEDGDFYKNRYDILVFAPADHPLGTTV